MLAIAEMLERGALDGSSLRGLGPVWDRTFGRSVTRRLTWPAGIRIVAVGGSTLGGSGKTPLAIACAAELAACGARVAFVGHAYRAAPGRARIVSADDRLDEVGDEALMAARFLSPRGASVVVAPTRAAAVAFAASSADVLVLDGVAQTAPARAHLSILAVDAAEPWGRAAAPPPTGDLRAPIGALLSACDAVVPMGQPSSGTLPQSWGRAGVGACGVWPAQVQLRGAWGHGGEWLTWDAIRAARVGIFFALARPDRVMRALAHHGVTPRRVVRVRDHGPIGRRGRKQVADARGIDLWLATPKCALHLRGSTGAPLVELDRSLVLDPALSSRLRALAAP